MNHSSNTVVHGFERRMLPEFFDGTSTAKTPESYTQIRDLMIRTYKEAPNVPLSATECRRHVSADVGSVVRLHQCLEHWGMINCATATASPPVLAGGHGDVSFRATLTSGGGEWSAQETLTLIDTLDTLAPDSGWEDVATQVGRSAEECISHFLALPIEEPNRIGTSGTSNEAAPSLGAQPSGASTSMLSQLALLSTAVDRPSGASTGCFNAPAAAADPLRAAARASASAVLARALELRPQADAALGALLATAVDVELRLVEMKLTHLEDVLTLSACEREMLQRMRGQQCADHFARDAGEQRGLSTAAACSVE